jgi:hypothetical protein
MQLFRVASDTIPEESDDDITKPPKRKQKENLYILDGVYELESFKSLIKKQKTFAYKQEL